MTKRKHRTPPALPARAAEMRRPTAALDPSATATPTPRLRRRTRRRMARRRETARVRPPALPDPARSSAFRDPASSSNTLARDASGARAEESEGFVGAGARGGRVKWRTLRRPRSRQYRALEDALPHRRTERILSPERQRWPHDFGHAKCAARPTGAPAPDPHCVPPPPGPARPRDTCARRRQPSPATTLALFFRCFFSVPGLATGASRAASTIFRRCARDEGDHTNTRRRRRRRRKDRRFRRRSCPRSRFLRGAPAAAGEAPPDDAFRVSIPAATTRADAAAGGWPPQAPRASTTGVGAPPRPPSELAEPTRTPSGHEPIPSSSRRSSAPDLCCSCASSTPTNRSRSAQRPRR